MFSKMEEQQTITREREREREREISKRNCI